METALAGSLRSMKETQRYERALEKMQAPPQDVKIYIPIAILRSHRAIQKLFLRVKKTADNFAALLDPTRLLLPMRASLDKISAPQVRVDGRAAIP